MHWKTVFFFLYRGYITKQLGHAESDLKFTDVEPFWSKM